MQKGATQSFEFFILIQHVRLDGAIHRALRDSLFLIDDGGIIC